MAGYENLKGHGFEDRTADERRELAIKAGKASGEARRRKADFRRTLNALLTVEIDSPEWTPVLEAMGISSTLESAINMAIIKRALSGDVKSYEAIAKYSGQTSHTDADLVEQRIRTDRARHAKDREVGNETIDNDGIQSFLKAMRPTGEELDSLFAGQKQEGGGGDAEETEETGDF